MAKAKQTKAISGGKAKKEAAVPVNDGPPKHEKEEEETEVEEETVEEETTAFFGVFNSKQEKWQAELDRKVRANQTKKDIPSVRDLLKYGDPETRDVPKTKWEVYGPPFALLFTFVVSLVLFHLLKDLAPPGRYDMPGMKRLPLFQKENIEKVLQQRKQRQSAGVNSPSLTGSTEDVGPKTEL